MIVECSACHSKYKYDETRFQGKKSKKIKCAKCSEVFEIVNPAFDTVPADEVGDATEGTITKKPSRPTSVSEPPTTETTKEMRIDPAVVAASGMGGGALFESKKFSLAAIAGPDAGKIFAIEKPCVTIGRSGADITVGDTEISRKHCQIEVKDDRVVLRDLQSTNGTFFADQRITSDVIMYNQTELTIGSTTLMLIITDKE